MGTIFFAIAIGYLANKLGFLGGETDKKLTGLLLQLLMPLMIVSVVLTNDDLPGAAQVLSILLVSGVYYGLSYLCALVFPRLFRVPLDQRGVHRFVLVFTNVGFIGYPVTVALFGESALFYAVILALPFNLLCYTTGPLLLSGGGGRSFAWKSLVNPCTLAAVFGVVAALTGLRLPAYIVEPIAFVGEMSIPFALVLLGSILAAQPIKNLLGTRWVWLLTTLRLAVMPVLLLLVLRLLPVEEIVLKIAVVQMAMPVAANGPLLALQYNSDPEGMAQVTFVSTVVSILSIPLVTALLL